MNNIGTTPTQNLPNLVTPFAAPSKNVVGLENIDNKDSVLPPVEQSNESARSLNRRQLTDETESGERVNAFGEDADGEEQQAAAEEQEKQAVIRQLAARDQEVRSHEAAHAAVGGALAGSPQFSYVRGPDGVLYASSGEVPINLGTASPDPEQQLQNAEQVQRAALAPAEPSAQDRQVAAQASQLAQQARVEIAEQRNTETEGANETASAKDESESSAVNESNALTPEQEKAEAKEKRLAAQAEEAQKEAQKKEVEKKEAREEKLREDTLREQALREQIRQEANARRFTEIQETVIPVNDLTQRILGLNKTVQDVKVGGVLDKRV